MLLFAAYTENKPSAYYIQIWGRKSKINSIKIIKIVFTCLIIKGVCMMSL